MNIRKDLTKIIALATAFTLGIGTIVFNHAAPVKVEAEQHIDNYSPYYYDGDYYDDLHMENLVDGMNGSLRTTLTTHLRPDAFYTYSGSGTNKLSTQLQYADEDPTNGDNMVLFYSRDSITKTDATVNSVIQWNREHVWCKNLSNGNWSSSSGGEDEAGTDILHLRPTYSSINSSRSDIPYGDLNHSNPKYYDPDQKKVVADSSKMLFAYSNGTYFEPLDSLKGDVARIIMYVWTTYTGWVGKKTYNSLNILNIIQSYDTLIRWHTQDKPDALEGHRNDYAEGSWQHNRNPFVDHPELAWRIFGDADGLSSSVKQACMEAYPGDNTPVDPTGISLDRDSASIVEGDTLQLIATLEPINASGSVTWSSNNPGVATVSSSGLVAAVSTGNATITATVGSYSASCTITVTEPLNYGTLENPLTVDEAINVIGTTQDVETAQPLYVKGVVTSNSAYNTKYSNYDYAWLQNEDGSETQAFELYRFKLSGVDGDYASANSMVGKEVVAYGYGKFYNGETYELSTSSNNPKNPLVYSITEQAVSSVDDYFDNASRYFELLGNEGTGLEDTTDFVTFSTAGLDNAKNIVDFSIGDVTLTSDVGNNTSGNRPKYYNTGTSMRVYWGNTFTFTCDENIKGINFTFSQGNSDSLSASVGVIDENTWTGNTKSVTFTNIDTSGQIRFSGISVTYEQEVLAVSNVAMRFGMSISKDDWNNINDEWGIDDYGVMMVKEITLEGYGVSSVKAAYKAGKTLKISRKGTYSEPYSLDEDNYLFTVKMNMTTVDSYNIVYCAAPFIVVDDEYYFLEDIRYSVNLMAVYFQSHDGCNLSSEALTLLSTLH